MGTQFPRFVSLDDQLHATYSANLDLHITSSIRSSSANCVFQTLPTPHSDLCGPLSLSPLESLSCRCHNASQTGMTTSKLPVRHMIRALKFEFPSWSVKQGMGWQRASAGLVPPHSIHTVSTIKIRQQDVECLLMTLLLLQIL